MGQLIATKKNPIETQYRATKKTSSIGTLQYAAKEKDFRVIQWKATKNTQEMENLRAKRCRGHENSWKGNGSYMKNLVSNNIGTRKDHQILQWW